MPDPFSPRGIPDMAFVKLVEERRAQLSLVAADWPDSPCLLADIGEYLVRSAVILSHLAKDLADGQHIKVYATQTINDMKKDTDFSDLDPLDYFDAKHSSLKDLASQLEEMASEIRSRWEQSRKPPELPTHHQKRPSQYGHISGAMGDINVVYNPMDEPTNHSRDASQSETGAVSHGTHNPGGRAQSPTVDDGINDTIQDLLKSSHLEKHQKLYKCELPGCKNHKGFARKDQLQRHQENVAHNTT
ncbi:predicted protein [Histoplasma capsulatum H143]|uniref:C2H2-type domain-containing protein n=1 Tax=Ajellomyces capsulatus (strain H143) TaxID=544712 RepID=C6H1X6_AJECH|nr:predicted protein [Histoplasma capsulatum H143]